MADTALSAVTVNSVLALADKLYGINSGPTSQAYVINRLLAMLFPVGGRLTTESGVPISTSDRTAQSTLYWTPYLSKNLALFDGTRWILYQLNELSLALSGLTSGKNYDAFVDNNSGTPALQLGPAWTNDTTRATGLTTQDGIKVLSGTLTSRWVGTIRTTGTTTTEDSGGGSTTQVGGKRYVWNAFNQVPRPLRLIDTADSWSYTTGTWRVWNGATSPLNAVEYVVGDAAVLIDAELYGGAFLQSNSARGPKIGIGVDSTSSPSGIRGGAYGGDTGFGQTHVMTSRYLNYPGLGYHVLNALEYGGDGSCTFVGDNAAAGEQTGMIVSLLG